MGGTRVFQNAPLKWNDLTPGPRDVSLRRSHVYFPGCRTQIKNKKQGGVLLAWSRRVNLDYGNYQLLRKIYYRQGRYYILLCGEERHRNAFRGMKRGVRNKWKFVVGIYECLNDEWHTMIIFDDLCGISLEIWSARIHKDLPKKVFQCGPINFWQMKWNIKADFSVLFPFPRSEINSSGCFPSKIFQTHLSSREKWQLFKN